MDTLDHQFISDKIELYLLFNDNQISKTRIRRQYTEYFYNNEEELEELIESIWSELVTRSMLYGKNCHYSVNDNCIEPKIKWQAKPELFLCLYFAIYGAQEEKVGTKLFERISGEAVNIYLKGENHLIGFPRNKGGLQKEVVDLANNQFELLGSAKAPKKYKDRGLDLIVWKSVGDIRGNQVTLLIQCAAGKHYESKKPVSIDTWRRYIDWKVMPLKGLTITQVITDKTNWNELSSEYGLIFDRTRLINQLDLNNKKKTYTDELMQWNKQKIRKIKRDINTI